ncbi:unnamed protein product, partial [Ectocarpus sp. 8 AP-2014]
QVCLHDEINCALVPCGHCFCAGCGSRVRECPVCRTAVTQMLKTFRP